MRLILNTYNPASTYSGNVLVSYIFSNSRPPKGLAGYIDWMTDGHISELIIRGKIGGKFCESLLLATGPKINTPMALIIGAGDPTRLDKIKIRCIGDYTIKVLDGLRISNFGLYPHDLFLPNFNIFRVMEELIEGFKSSSSRDVTIGLLSNGLEQQEIITKWLQRKN